MARRPTTPKIEEAPVEDAPKVDLVTPDDPGGRPVDADPGEDLESVEKRTLDVVGEINRLHAYITSLHDVVNAMDQRVSDLETLKGQEFLPTLYAEVEGNAIGGPGSQTVTFEDDEDDIPDFVNGVQQAFNRDSGDDTPWFNS